MAAAPPIVWVYWAAVVFAVGAHMYNRRERLFVKPDDTKEGKQNVDDNNTEKVDVKTEKKDHQ